MSFADGAQWGATLPVDKAGRSRERFQGASKGNHGVSGSDGLNDVVYLYEDDQALAEEIILAFAAEGTKVEPICDEQGLRRQIRQGAPAFIIDRMIAGRDSLDMVQEARAAGDRSPVMVISSLSTVDDRIFGLKSGGDDYLIKPFAMGELIARVGALRRRALPDVRTRLAVGTLELDLITRRVRRGNREVSLLPREFALLEYLMRHAGQVVTRAMLLEDVWHYHLSSQTNVVDVQVGNLRRKIEALGEARLIASVRGLGFMLAADEAEP